MRQIFYYIIFAIIALLVFIDAVVLYLIIFKHRKIHKFFGLLAAFVAMLSVLLAFSPPRKYKAGGLSTTVRFFTRTYAINNGNVYNTLLSNSHAFGDYELIYTINNQFNSSVKIDSMSLNVNSYENGDMDFISPEGGGGGDTGYQYFYGVLEEDQNELLYLGNDYGKLDLDENKKSFVKISSHDLEACSVYFDCSKSGIYEISLKIIYSGSEKGEYVSEPLKLCILPYEVEQEQARVIPLGDKSDALKILIERSERKEKLSDTDYEIIEAALMRHD